jgi:hypothetical protein
MIIRKGGGKLTPIGVKLRLLQEEGIITPQKEGGDDKGKLIWHD